MFKMKGIGREKDTFFGQNSLNNFHNQHNFHSVTNGYNVGSSSVTNNYVDHHQFHNMSSNYGVLGNGVNKIDDFGLIREFEMMNFGNRLSKDVVSSSYGLFGNDYNVGGIRPSHTANFGVLDGFNGNEQGFFGPLGKDVRNYKMLGDRLSNFDGNRQFNCLIDQRDEYYRGNTRGNDYFGSNESLIQNYGALYRGNTRGNDYFGNESLIQNYGALLEGRVLGENLNSGVSRRNSLYNNTMKQNMKQPYTSGNGLNGGSVVHGNRRKTAQMTGGIGSPVRSSDSMGLYTSLEDVRGNIHSLAKDQNGCRFLQNKFDDGSFNDVQIIFSEIIDHVVELIIDPFGNYLIQKFLDVFNEEQLRKFVNVITRNRGELVRICLNSHGTRVVQKLIDTLKTRKKQIISVVIQALEPGFLDLIKDLNGNHVVQCCLQHLNYEDTKFIFDAASKYCVEIGTHRHGCCVLQQCISHSNGDHQIKLIEEVCKNALIFAQDPFGNYVVQYIIGMKIPSAAAQLTSQFKGNYVHLSMQKFSSHVVEKCLNSIEESREQIVYELLLVSRFDQLLQDPFANYVVQCALDVTKGAVNESLVAAVRPHSALRTNPHCKKIFTKGLIRK